MTERLLVAKLVGTVAALLLPVALLLRHWRRRRSWPSVSVGLRNANVRSGAESVTHSPPNFDPWASTELVRNVSIGPSSEAEDVLCQVSARQVFDVQWSFLADVVHTSDFKAPAGTGPKGGFIRPEVNLATDQYRLLPSSTHSSQYALWHYDEFGTVRHQMTSHGRIKAISPEIILYMGDGEYGTLVTLTKDYEYGSSSSFGDLKRDPSKETIQQVLKPNRAAALRELRVECPRLMVLERQSADSPGVKGPSTKDARKKSSACGFGMQWLRDGDTEVRYLSPAGQEVRFNSRVSCAYVRDMTQISAEQKAEFWWQPDDFAEFLQVRVEIGKAYRAVAKKLGVDVLKVSSVGSHGEEGYKAMIAAAPELAQESRRGLGLGRKKQRAKNRDAYIAAVIEEQRRQREAHEAALLKTNGTTSAFSLDAEELARVGHRVSEKDMEYAHYLAQTYYEQDRATIGEPPSVPVPPSLPPSPQKAPVNKEDGSPSSREDCISRLLVRSDSMELIDNKDWKRSISPGGQPSHSTKGFGLSRDKLQAVGLSVTGHSISRHQRLRTAPGLASQDSDGETDDSMGGPD